MHISWARLAGFCHLGIISDPLIVSKFHNETHDPKGQESKIYTRVKGRETYYRRHTVPVTSCSESFILNFFTFLPFIALFSPSSDIQGAREGHPPACHTNYKYGILMVNWYACPLLSFIYHTFWNQKRDSCTQPLRSIFHCILVSWCVKLVW